MDKDGERREGGEGNYDNDDVVQKEIKKGRTK